MRTVLLMMLGFVLAGCATRLDRAELDRMYQSTSLAEGVYWARPLHADPDAPPPVIVNWWYAGTSRGDHVVVYRELTWTEAGEPRATQRDYRIAQAQLPLDKARPYSRDDDDWLPLFAAAPDAFAVPADVLTTRVDGGPRDRGSAVTPVPIDPRDVQPETIEPDGNDPLPIPPPPGG